MRSQVREMGEMRSQVREMGEMMHATLLEIRREIKNSYRKSDVRN